MAENGQALTVGQATTLWAARASLLLYLWALWLQVRHQWRLERLISTCAFTTYLVHVLCAFAFFYHWSHSFALRETERQTADLFGIAWGGGLYLNYALTIVWLGDCAVSWLKPDGRAARPRWAGRLINAFFVFMFLNASVVVWVIKASR